MKLAHIARNNSFFQNVSYQFELAFNEKNTYFIHSRNKNINSTDNVFKGIKHIKFVTEANHDISMVFNDIQDYDILFLHGLDMFSSKLLLNGPIKPKVVLLFYGSEIYENSLLMNKMPYGNLTLKNYNLYRNKILRFKEQFLYKLKYRFDTLEGKIKKALRKIDYFAVIHKEDYDYMINNNIISSNTKYFPFSFYPIEYLIQEQIETTKNNNILIGNSRTFANNHLEIFKILSSFDLKERKIIVPFSYGNIIYYKDILKDGKAKLGSGFTPLLEILPLKEYNKILNSCSIAIMNHYRQQAVGNIITLVYSGAKVYLTKKNTIYSFLKRIGCIIYSIETDLVTENKEALQPLNEKEKEHNRTILFNLLNINTLIHNLKSEVESILLMEPLHLNKN